MNQLIKRIKRIFTGPRVSPSQDSDFWETGPDFDGPARPTVSDDGQRIWIPDPPTDSFTLSPSPEDYVSGIHPFLDLSTGHLPEKDFEQLREYNQDSIVRTIQHRYGTLMFISGDLDELKNDKTIPESLKNVIQYAERFGCWLINFDRDGQQIDVLNYYDW